MTNEFAIKVLTELRGYGDKFANIGFDRKEALDLAIKALEQQPCEDCISREAVLDYITKLLSGYLYAEERERLEDLTTYIAEMSSVTPQRPKGRWIEQKDIHKHHYGWSFCSECGAFLMSSDGANFCSCCGSKMEDES